MNIDQSIAALGEVLVALALIAGGVAVLEGALYLILVRWLKARLAVPLMLIAPAFVGLLGLIIYPLLWELNVSFTNMSLRNFRDPGLLGLAQGMFIGLDNYVRVFTQPVLQQASFWQVLWQTVLWTAINVAAHVAGGLGLALLLHRSMRFKGV